MKKKVVKKVKAKVKSGKARKVARKAAPAPIKKAAQPKPIGVVTHFYGGIKVAIVKFSKPVKVGAPVRFLGATTDFAQAIQSLQFDHKDIASAPKGKEVGTKVKKRVREGDQVFLAE